MKRFLVFFVLIAASVNSQNWNVFNKNYRYNYKFDHSALISNVLFVDSAKQQGADTVYHMNRIGEVSGNVLLINQPQFLNRTIIKSASGKIILQDPETHTIIPTCTLNQTWLFNAPNNYSATCVAINTISLFSIIDSVKTILLNNIDSVLLSKQFGLIQFPKLYAQNKYYRLVGIEEGSKYDSIPLFGLKMPNAWDFYNYNVGDQWCSISSDYYISPGFSYSHCDKTTSTIKTKTITSAGYIYNVDVLNHKFNGSPSAPCLTILPPVTTTSNINLVFSGIDQKTLNLNFWYPDKVIQPISMLTGDIRTLAKLGTDNNGIFYKYYGVPNCGINPNTDGVGLYKFTNGAYILTNDPTHNEVSYGTGINLVNDNSFVFEGGSDYCLTCLVKNNVLVIGVGLNEQNSLLESSLIYPNPATTILNFQVNGKVKVKVYNSLGALVKEEFIEDKSAMDIINLPKGLYFVEIQNDSFKATRKVIIQH